MNDLVQKVNDLLLKGEPGNISVDEHSGYTGYKPQAIIDAMNEVLWSAWGFEEVESSIEPGDKGGLAVAQVRVWLKDVEFRPVGWGQNRVTRGDIGDARKGAQTDAIKKALSYFSIGNRAYHGLLDAKAKSNGHAQQSATPAQATLKAVETGDAPDILTLHALCDEVMGKGKWAMVRGYIVDPQKYGDMPDGLLTVEQRRAIHKALLAKKQAKTAKAS